MAAFATVTELEEFMGTSGLGARGTAMLGYASAEIRRFTGQDLEATTGRQEEHAGGMGRAIIQLTQQPVTAVSAITVDAVALTADDFIWTRWGKVYQSDWSTWDDGPILITYDSGYAVGSDEMEAVKAICCEVVSRALAGPAPQETFGLDVPEARGFAPSVFLTTDEQMRLDSLGMVAVG